MQPLRFGAQRLIRQRLPELRRCGEGRGVAGRLVLRWFITAEGKVIQLKVMESSLGDPELERCILARVKAWRFAAHGGKPVQVVLPFVLASDG